MNQLTRGLATLALAFLGATPLNATEGGADEGPWIHIRVLESGARSERVSINIPLSLVEIALEMAPKNVIMNGRINLHESDVTVADLRRAWKELRAAGDAEFVTVDGAEERVRVARKGNRLLVNVTALPAGTQKVKIAVPLPIVDALFSGHGSSLEIRGAIAQLKTLRGEILAVDDEGSQVRIWIDDRPGGRS